MEWYLSMRDFSPITIDLLNWVVLLNLDTYHIAYVSGHSLKRAWKRPVESLGGLLLMLALEQTICYLYYRGPSNVSVRRISCLFQVRPTVFPFSCLLVIFKK